VETPGDIANLVREDIERLRAGTVLPTRGDVRCILFGHMIRLAIWQLRRVWTRDMAIEERLAAVARYIQNTGGFQSVEQCLGEALLSAPRSQRTIIREDKATYGINTDEVAFHAFIIEAKITSDDGTARDKVARIKKLETQRNQHVASGRAGYEVVACIDGRGFRKKDAQLPLTFLLSLAGERAG
jgi:hypothetical protein